MFAVGEAPDCGLLLRAALARWERPRAVVMAAAARRDCAKLRKKQSVARGLRLAGEVCP